MDFSSCSRGLVSGTLVVPWASRATDPACTVLDSSGVCINRYKVETRHATFAIRDTDLVIFFPPVHWACLRTQQLLERIVKLRARQRLKSGRCQNLPRAVTTILAPRRQWQVLELNMTDGVRVRVQRPPQ